MPVRVDTRPERLTRAQWARYENVGLEPSMSLERLEFRYPGHPRAGLDAYGTFTAIELEATIEGAPTVTISVRDPDLRLMSEGLGRVTERARQHRGKRVRGSDPVAVDEGWESILEPATIGRAMDVTLDGITFRLVGVRFSSATGEAELTFEHRLVYWLRRKRGARRASRASCTRAQFVLALVREVRALRYRFVCPELNVRQPIASSGATRGIRTALGLSASSSSSSVENSAETTASGFAPGASITVKGRAATSEQRRNLETALGVADGLSASPKARKALVLGGIEESAWINLSGGEKDSSGVLQVRASTARGIPGLDARDVAGVSRTFLEDGYWKHRPKGAIELAKAHPEWTAAQITQACQGSAPARYAKWDRDADRILEAWSGTGAEAGAAGGTYRKSYQFTRNADEDSWTAIQRLAEEVGWRAFVVGNSIYFISEADLYRRRPRYEIGPDDPAVLEFSYDVDWGKSVSEATLSVVLDRWGAPPGSVVVVDGYGIADGRWLVTAVRRDYFSPVAEVTLKQPGRAKMEPAAETSSSASATGAEDGAGSSSKAQQVYDAAQAISEKRYPYTWGGGHARCGTADGGTGRDPGPGYDCSGCVCAALAAAGLGFRTGGPAADSGTIARTWGQAGRGKSFTVWANSGHVWIEWHGLGSAKRFDTSPHGDTSGRGPRQRSTERSDQASFTPRHWEGC